MTLTNRELSAAERIRSNLEAREAHLAKIFQVLDDGQPPYEPDEDDEAWAKEDLGFDSQSTMHWSDVLEVQNLAEERALERVEDEYRSEGLPLSGEAANDALFEFPIGVSHKVHVRIELSTGGPGDWLEVIGEPRRYGGLDVEDVRYHFVDWYDHAEESVNEASALWRFAEYIADTYPGE